MAYVRQQKKKQVNRQNMAGEQKDLCAAPMDALQKRVSSALRASHRQEETEHGYASNAQQRTKTPSARNLMYKVKYLH